MVDPEYPHTVLAFDEQFPSEEACHKYLVKLRWPSGFVCPRCGATEEAWLTARGLMHCKRCSHQSSVTAGTLFHRTRMPLRAWFHAIWWVTSQKNGASALGLQHILGLGSYETAWTWLHKLRRAMIRPGRDRLTGRVEVDESFVGGFEAGAGGRHVGKKVLVAIAAEVRGRAATGRIRLEAVEDSSATSLLRFVERVVTPGSTVITDGLNSYSNLEKIGYKHSVRISRKREDGSRLLPRVHRVASLLKRWLLGTHQGSVERQHMPYYLDEFTFRFNRRTSRHRGLLFYRLLHQAVNLGPVPYSDIVGGKRPQDIGVT